MSNNWIFKGTRQFEIPFQVTCFNYKQQCNHFFCVFGGRQEANQFKVKDRLLLCLLSGERLQNRPAWESGSSTRGRHRSPALPAKPLESPNSRSSCRSFTGFNSYTHKSWRASFAPDFSCLCTPLDVWGCDSEGNRSEKPQCCAVQTWLSLCFYKGESGHCVFNSFVFCKNMCLLLQRESRLDICAPAQLLIFVCCLSLVEALVSTVGTCDLPRNTTFKYKWDCCCC